MAVTDQRETPIRQKPLLVLVSGAPATGKTTLARHLADALALPLLARDTITNIVADAFGAPTRDQRDARIQASFAIYYGLLDEFARAGLSVVAETNFHRGVSERDLYPRIACTRALLIHCQTTREVSVRRFIERFERGERHPASFDGERIARLQAGEPQPAWERAVGPVDLPIPTMLVNTTSGYAPNFAAIVAFIRSVTGPAQ
ncbi:MAG: AAA family ATPase [Thermomicrobiales bacterium]